MWPDSPWVVDATGNGVRANLTEIEVVGDEPPESPELVGDFAEKLVRRFLRLCESPRTRDRMLGMVRTSVDGDGGGAKFYARLNRMVVHPLARVSGVHASASRWELVGAQLVGVAMMRYVLAVEPIASADAEDIVAQLAPAIRATLKGS